MDNSQISLEKNNQNNRGRIVARVPRGTFFPIKSTPQPVSKSRMFFVAVLKIIAPLVGIALVYGVINLVLVGGQELWHSGDKKEMTKIEEQLKQKEKTIVNYEYKNTVEGLTETEYSKYTKEVDDYNELVGRYNELAEKVGSTWYVIPVPGKH